MPKIAFPRRKPIAGFGARVFRNLHLIFDVATAALLITVLAFPALVFRKGNANAASTVAPVPYSAPPEPFVIHSAARFSGFAASILTATSDAIAALAPATVPAGLENAKMPTIAERVMSKAGLATSLSTKSAMAPPAPPQPTSVVDFDFDNDGKADIGRWHSANTEFKVKNSNGGSYSTFTVGSSSATLAPGDFNGDGKTDAAVFSGGTWTYKTSTSASAQTISWGASGDIPVASDYDGDGTTDAAIYRPSTNTWWVSKSSGGYTSTGLGSSGDIVAPGDYDGDGKTDLAVYRPSNGYWYINGSTVGSYTFGWGISIDTPVPADYDGDGKTDPAVFRPSTGTWYAYRSGLNNGSYYTQAWGNYADQPVPADYDGDSKADYAIWRPTTGVWYILNSSDSSYSTHALGVPGDKAVPSAYLKQVGGEVSGDALAAARLLPRNATGGTNLYSQNFSWGTSLVSLPGRAGLDAGFGISYNSLVWTKVGSAIVFDADSSNAGPGFRFGFPVIEPVHYDSGKSVWSYIMATPSGGRAEFRQTAVSNTYETADSSYTQLVTTGATNPNDPVEDISIKVTTTDGTQMTYAWNLGAYRCAQIKDRNGNYISIAYDFGGRLETMTDTLGRVVTVNYDGTTGYPSTITQTWKTNNGEGSGTTTHAWATLTYATKTVDTDFSGLTVVGPPDDTVVNVLDKITYADNSFTKFEYNGYLQVKKISNIAADSTSHVLNYVSTNLGSPSSSQTDCPRFTETRTWVENFNVNGSGVPLEVVVTNSNPTSATYSLPDSISGSASRIDVAVTGHPDGLYSRTYVGSSGWKEGLTLATEDCIGTNCSDRKRWTWTDWTQDNTSLSYVLNPRVTESRVGDSSNTKRTTLSYHVYASTTIAKYGLSNEVQIYDTDLSTVLKKSVTDYELGSSYTSKRILGLPSEVKTYGRETSGLNLMTKVTYAYDEGNFSDSGLSQNISPTQHDSSYDSSFITGRGNLTSATRWNVDYSTNSTYAVTSSTKYNVAGSPVAKISPWDGTNTRTVRIGYADSWNDGVSRTTYAYPTVVTDPAGTSLGDSSHSSTVKYRFDIGANVEANSPAPTGNTYGKKSKRVYDSVGRLERDSVFINTTEHAYTRYEYPTTGIQTKAYSTIVDTDTDGADTDDEVLSENFMDGAGRVRLTRTPHTFSSGGTATWAGTVVEYDIIGRVKRQSVPTEVNSSWAATGDDATRGFLWTYQKYDWMNRVVRKLNTDGDPEQTENDSDVFIAYSTCGCAGGLVTTIQGEEIIEKDWDGSNPTSLGRRTQKLYQDTLGRTWKSEIMNWNGTTVYSTNTSTFNGRDQALTATLTEASTSVSQVRTMGYDGHGRLISRHIPQQDVEAETTYAYNPDDSIASMTDGREVETNHVYNSMGLVEEISHTLPEESEIPATPVVNFDYDNLGNRIEMTDGLGEVDYEYNSLSRMTAETRDFTDTLSSAPNGVFRIEYTYTIGGQLKSLEDPYGDVINYAHDKVGRLSAVTGTSFAGVTSYASSPHYRAWGGLQSVSYSNNTVASMTFDNRLRANHSQLVKNGTTTLMSKDYSFYADGALRKTDDLVDDKFDRLTTYDIMARPKTSTSGLVARGGTPSSEQWYDVPYVQSYSFNAFGNLSGRDHKHWGTSDYDFEHAYTNNRLTTGIFNLYDADGRQTRVQEGSDILETTYDAAGRPTFFHRYIAPSDESEITRHYNGDALEEKREQRGYVEVQPDQWEWVNGATEYYIRSTVMGGNIISNTSPTGEKYRTFVRAAGAEIAWQNKSGSNEEVVFQNWDAAGMTYATADSSGTPFTNFGSEGGPAELDSMGGNLGSENPYLSPIPGNECVGCGVLGWEDPMFVNGQPLRFNLNGMDIPLSMGLAFFAGKQFALIQWQANLSMREIGRWYRSVETPNPEPLPGDDGILGTDDDIQRVGNTDFYLRSIEYETSWSFSSAVFSFQTKRKDSLLSEETRKSLEAGFRERLGRNKGKCKEKLDELLQKLGKAFSSGGKTGIEALADQFFNNPKFGLYASDSVSDGGVAGYSNKRIRFRRGNPSGSDDFNFIHELIHAARGDVGYSHQQIVQAIASMEGLYLNDYHQDLLNEARNLKKAGKIDSKDDYVEDQYRRRMNNWIGNYCTYEGGNQPWKDFVKQNQ